MGLLTDHARTRMQQRGIRLETLEALLDFGRIRHLHAGGREVVFFDKKAKARLARANPGAAREAEKLTRAYAIMGLNGVVITVGHRFRRVPHAKGLLQCVSAPTGESSPFTGAPLPCKKT